MNAIITTQNGTIVEGRFEQLNGLLIFIEVKTLTAESAQQLANEGLYISSRYDGTWGVSAPLRIVKEYTFVD